MSKLQQYIEQEKMYSNEGSRGVSNLCKIVAAMGYKDPFYQGALSGGGKTGDLMVFLEDNPGAIDALIEWIDARNVPEWDEALSSELHVDEDEEEDNEDEEETD